MHVHGSSISKSAIWGHDLFYTFWFLTFIEWKNLSLIVKRINVMTTPAAT